MSVELHAPFAGPTAILFMPSPILQNEEALEQSVNHRLAMDGTNYTYVKSSTDRRLTMTFENMGRGKIVELQEFFKLFVGERVRFVDWRGDQWNVIFEEDVLEATADGRSGKSGGSREEQGSFDITLIGVKL